MRTSMPESYGQFCPIAQAAEVVNERWTLLVIREMMMGSSRFNDIQRGVPRMSSSLLSKRLRELEQVELISKEPLPEGRGHTYHLTPAGLALGPMIVSLGTWGRDWLKRDITMEEADPSLLMWDMRRAIRVERLPKHPLVAFIRLRDAVSDRRAWWLVAREDDTDLCFTDPGFEVDLEIDAEVKALAEVWVGKRELGQAMDSQQIKVTGPDHLVRTVPDWIGLSTFAYPDPAAVLAERDPLGILTPSD